MNNKTLISLVILLALLVGCESQPVAPWSSEDDVVLVEVDGQPISLPMLEFMMENRGVGEDDHEAMRGLLDELIRLRVVANAAEAEGVGQEPKLRAERAIRDLEALQIAYFTDVYERYPVTEAQIQETYERQIERSGQWQFRLRTVRYEDQGQALLAIVERAEAVSGAETAPAIGRTEGEGMVTPWIDRSQLPERLWSELDEAKPGQVLSLPIPAPTGSGWLVGTIEEIRALSPPPLSEVQEGIARSLVRQRLEALVDDLYEAAEIVPMLPLDGAEAAHRAPE